jgi:hypothetical protein
MHLPRYLPPRRNALPLAMLFRRLKLTSGPMQNSLLAHLHLGTASLCLRVLPLFTILK